MNITLNVGSATGPTKTFSTCSFNPANMIIKPASSQDTSADAWLYNIRSTPWPGDTSKTFKYIDIEVRNARLITGLTLTNPLNAIIQPWKLKYNADLDECFFMDSNAHSHAIPVGEKPDDWDARWRDKYYLKYKRMWGGGTNGPNKYVTWFNNVGNGVWNSQETFYTIDEGYEPTRVYVAPSGLAFGVAEILTNSRIISSSSSFGLGRFCTNAGNYNENYIPWRYPGVSGSNIFGQTDIRFYFAPGGFNQQADFTAKTYVQMVSFRYDGEDYIGYAIIWFNADGIPLNAACYGASAFAWGDQGGGGEYSGPTSVPAGGSGTYTDTNVNVTVNGINGNVWVGTNPNGIKTYKTNAATLDLIVKDICTTNWGTTSPDKVVQMLSAGVVDCYALPFEAGAQTNLDVTILGEEIKTPGTQLNLNQPVITEAQTYFDFGSVELPHYYDNFLDFAPYTKMSINLPWIGKFELPVNDFMYGELRLKYRQDNYTGDLVAFIETTNQFGDSHIVAQFQGNGKYTIPFSLTGKNNQALVSALAGVGKIAGGAMSGAKMGSMVPGLGTAAGAVIGGTVATVTALPDFQTALNAPPDTSHTSVSLNGNASWLGYLDPYIEITRTMYNEPETYGRDRGYTSNVSVRLSELTGFAIIKNLDASGLIGCTEQERAEILLLLSKGCYFRQVD